MNSNILFFKSVLYSYPCPAPKNFCKLEQAVSCIWVGSSKGFSTGSNSAGHSVPLPIMRLGSPKTQEPGRSVLHSPLPKQEAWSLSLHRRSMKRRWSWPQNWHRRGAGVCGIISLPMCKITVTCDRLRPDFWSRIWECPLPLQKLLIVIYEK